MKILIIIVSIIALSAVGGSIIVGEKMFDGVVVEKPYEQGLLWDRIQDSKSELGWSAVINNGKIKTGDGEVSISVFDKEGKPLSDATVSLIVSRPSTNAYDKDYKTVKLHEGLYTAAVNFPLYGYWDMKIHVGRKGKDALLEERIFADN
ncbi:MAG: FixH family protein [Nitrospirae bacterium]|nr:FixH family protein [Nitrospirota bacterium]